MGGVANEFMEKVKDKNSGVKLMGFGHRVYKNYDPRAKLFMQETCNEVLANWAWKTTRCSSWPRNWKDRPGRRLLRAAQSSTRTWTSTPASCSAIGIPVSLFTGIFALVCTVGWIAQLNETLATPRLGHRLSSPVVHRRRQKTQRKGRPALIAVLRKTRPWQPVFLC